MRSGQFHLHGITRAKSHVHTPKRENSPAWRQISSQGRDLRSGYERVEHNREVVDLKFKVELKILNREYKLSVEDNGKGISPALRARLFFTPLRGGHPTHTGLGIYNAHLVITKLFHGRMNCEPNEPRGTVFVLSLPCGDRSNRNRQTPLITI